MNKAMFLNNLKNELRWNLKSKEISDVLMDYESFFDKAISEGKSENDTCTELGSPATIASDIVSELTAARFILAPNKLWRIVIGTLLLMIATAFFSSTYSNKTLVYGVTAMPILICALWLVVNKHFNMLPPVTYKKSNRSKYLILVFHAIILIVIIGSFIMIYNTNPISSTDVPYQILASFFALAYSRIGFIAIVLLISLYSLYGFYSKSPYHFTVLCHAIGALAFFGLELNTFANINQPEIFRNEIVILLVTYIISILFTLISATLIRTLLRRA